MLVRPEDHTHELRWMVPGPLPEDVLAAAADLPVERRVDRYLRLRDPAVGVKLRDDRRLEVKRQQGGDQPWSAHGATGNVQEWHRWTFTIDPERAEMEAFRSWTPVAKARRTQLYRVGPDADLSATDTEDPAGGAKFEVTAIDTPVPTWTVAVDCWAVDPDQVPGVLSAVVALHPRLPWDRLAPERSRSYPAWLEDLET